jgi:hypothetical protein
VSVLRALAARIRARWWTIAAATLAVFAVYQASILVVLVAGLGGPPNYVRRHAAWENARRIVRLTPSALDTAVLVAREPLVEYGRLHPAFGVAVWSFELTWLGLLFFLSVSALVGVHLGIGGRAGRSAPACPRSRTAGSAPSACCWRSAASPPPRSSGSGGSSPC